MKEHRGGDRKSVLEKDARIELIKCAFRETRAWRMTTLSARVGFSRSACFSIVTEILEYSKMNAKYVPHELTPMQKKNACAVF